MISSIPYMFDATLDKDPDKRAIFSGSEVLTFGQLYREVMSTAHVLKDLGVTDGSRVGICMTKTLDQVITILATVYSGAVFVPILPNLKKSNIQHIVKDSGMTVLIADSSRLEEVKEHAGQLKLVIGHGTIDDVYPFLPYLRKYSDTSPKVFSRIGSDNAAIIYSSGSTGRPKGIVISHRNLFDGARIVSSYLNTTKEDRIAGVLSLNFDYGLNQLWQTIYKGSSLYLHDLVFPNDLFDFLSRERITGLPVMPVMISKMFDPRFYFPKESHDFSYLRYVCSSGGRISQKMLDHLVNTFSGIDVYSMYGLTEAFRSTYLPPKDISIRPDSIGLPIPDVGIYVVDDNNQDCDTGVKGELVHRGGCIAKGYWNDPERTSQVFREIDRFPGETVVFSGDIVKQDQEGYFYFVGRKDSMIKTHGYRVSPTEIEEEAGKHKSIVSSVAFGVVNPEVGEDIVLVYTTGDRAQINHRVLMQYLKDVLPSHMVPALLVHLEEFPTTGNEGKVDRQLVQEMVITQMGSNPNN